MAAAQSLRAPAKHRTVAGGQPGTVWVKQPLTPSLARMHVAYTRHALLASSRLTGIRLPVVDKHP
jgi:hypothetical protein